MGGSYQEAAAYRSQMSGSEPSGSSATFMNDLLKGGGVTDHLQSAGSVSTRDSIYPSMNYFRTEDKSSNVKIPLS